MRKHMYGRTDTSFIGLCLRVLGISGLISLAGAGALLLLGLE